MKKIFAIIAVAIVTIFSANTVNAQSSRACQDVQSVSIRPYVGLSATAVVNSDVDLGAKGGFTVGADAQYMLNKWFGVSAGVEMVKGGWEYKAGDWKGSEATVNLLGTPILANFYLCKGLAFKVGAKPNFILNSSVTKDAAGNTHEFKGDDALNTFNVNGVLGISYEYKNVVLEVRENFGTAKLLKNDSRSLDKAALMGDISVSVGYRF